MIMPEVMERNEDFLQVLKVRGATPVYDQNDKRVIAWKLMTDDGEHEITPKQMGADPERLIFARFSWNDGNLAHPTTTCSSYYAPISHQKVLHYFLGALAKKYGGGFKPHKNYLADDVDRMVRVYFVGEPTQIFGETLEFGMSITNSYDLSLGIKTDGFLYEKNEGYGFFLGTAGKWTSTFKHYWSPEKLQEKMTKQIINVLEAKEERIEKIKKFSEIFVSTETFTAVGRSLNLQKNEIEAWQMLTTPDVNTVWVKNAGFTVQNLLRQVTAWDMLKMFAKWSSRLDDDRKLDIAQRLYAVVDHAVTPKKV